MNRLATLALASLLVAPLAATATPITYQIKFTVLTGSVRTVDWPEQGTPSFDDEDATGNVYFGRFAIDDEILASDGIGKPGNLDFFHIQMEDNIWGYNFAADNSFSGFRGPIPGDPFCLMSMACLDAPSPGFDVVNGAITNLRGGVYGVNDIPFVDFSPLGAANRFAAIGDVPFVEGTSASMVGTGSDGIYGTMEIFRVPEPGALSLFGLGLLILARTSRRARTLFAASRC